MKTTLPAAYFKNRFNRVSNCAITQDICSRLLGLLHAFVYQSYNNFGYDHTYDCVYDYDLNYDFDYDYDYSYNHYDYHYYRSRGKS